MKLRFIATFIFSIVLFGCKDQKIGANEIRHDRTNVIVKISTNKGDIKISLSDETPQHRDNFLYLVDNNMYVGVKFHRVIEDFMIQAGDLSTRKGEAKVADYTVPAEFVPSLYHKKGALAAARQGDFVNPKKESSGTQFYIVQGEIYFEEELAEIEEGKKQTNPAFSFTSEMKEIYRTVGGAPFLDADYTVFGEVLEGLDIVDAIASVETVNEVPVTDIIIKKIEILTATENK